ncbi:MAG: biopolymer transporter ExbD [Bdellovibrionia bacterium]
MNVEGRRPGNQRNTARTSQTTLSEINVTPLVDVMLVLLIIFMISAPLMQQGIHVDLPKANAGTLDEIPDQLILVVDKSRQILIANRPVQSGTLRTKLEAIVAAKPKIEVVIQADQNVNYGYVARVMGEVKKAGINRVGLATQPGDSQARL